MSRRTFRRSGVGVQRGLAQRFRSLFDSAAGDWWFDASHVSPIGGFTASVIDYIDPSHMLSQASAPLRCAVPSEDSAIGGQKSVEFSAHYYESNRGAASWKYRHDGSPVTEFCVFVPTAASPGLHVQHSTCRIDLAAGDIGAALYLSTATPVVANINVAATPLALLNGSYTVTSGVPVVTGFQAGTARNPDGAIYVGQSTRASSDYGSAVSTSNPTGPLRLGAAVDGTKFGEMRWRASYGFHRILTAIEVDVVMDWIAADCGFVPTP